MIRGLWGVFLALIGGASEETEPDRESRFVPSPLDLSVRVGHGGRDDEVVRELSKVSERARELEARSREK